MKKAALVSLSGLLMFLALSLVARAQGLVDITGEFKSKSYDCEKNPRDSGVSQSFSTPAKGFIRITNYYYPSASRGLSKGGILWSIDGKNWAGETAMARLYYKNIGTNYWELRSSGKSGPGKNYTEWYSFEINSANPIKNWQVGIFPQRGVSTSRHRPQQVVVRDLIGGASPWLGTAPGQESGPSGRLAPVAGKRATPGIESCAA